jgi:uncharacterized protein
MKQAHFRFYAELNDLLLRERRMATFPYDFSGRRTVRSLIEDLGVPHTEVDVILVNGQSVDFAHLVEDGDNVSVYPTFESLDVTPQTRLRPKPLRETRFVADAHLGRLAAYLRLLGFDTRYARDEEDANLVAISCSERRILLTRDRELLKRGALTHGLFVHATQPRQQLEEVLRRLDLNRSVQPFSRCLECNQLLEQVPVESVADRIPASVRVRRLEFRQCPDCERVYWPGSHYRRMQQFLKTLELSDPIPDPKG